MTDINTKGPKRELALFAGGGGGILGGHLLGWRPVCAVEIRDGARDVLLARQRDGILPQFPIWDDVCTFNGRIWRGRVDVISAGFPCQDISWAWAGKGIEGKKSGLWWETYRIVQESLPAEVLVENVGNLRKRGLDAIRESFRRIGYHTLDIDLLASDLGAPQPRIRTWLLAWRDWRPVVFASDCGPCDCCEEPVCPYCAIHYSECDCPGPHSEEAGDGRYEVVEEDWGVVAYPHGARRQEQRRSGTVQPKYPPAQCSAWWAAEPGVVRVVHGLAGRVDRLISLGNGQVPAVAATAYRILSHYASVTND